MDMFTIFGEINPDLSGVHPEGLISEAAMGALCRALTGC
jgi:hypothetical protein